ncbi:BhlA/UviB family holin-like peptide [Virgibacillus natechei]
MEIAGLPLELFVSQGVFAVLFVWLFIDSRKEAKAREAKLMDQINHQNVAQGRIVQSLERLEEKINSIKGGK